MRHHVAMADRERDHLHGVISLLIECHETAEALFTRFEGAEDSRAKRKIVEAALYELKIHAVIEELVLHPALEPELVEPRAKREAIQSLISELEPMTGGERRHDEAFAALAEKVRRHIREEESALFARPRETISL